MTSSEHPLCIIADMSVDPHDLLVLRAVARTGRFTGAADELALNHTTVSRRIQSLERALGGRVLSRAAGGWEPTELGRRALRAADGVSEALDGLAAEVSGADLRPKLAGVVRLSATDGYSALVAAPAVADLQREHPELQVEIVTVTRRALQQRSGLDIEVVVGRPQVHRAEAVLLGEYVLGMYASERYLAEHGAPQTRDELVAHPLVYFIDSMLQVDDLDAPRRLVPGMRDSLTSTNVFVHVEATRAGAGIGFLPCFVADRHLDLVRVLPEEIAEVLPYWMVLRPDSLDRPAVAAVVAALRERTAAMADALRGERRSGGRLSEPG
jgi:DNA-binding transcriptional LysR family regulator